MRPIRNGLMVALALLIIVIGLLVWRFPAALEGQDAKIRLVSALLILSVFLLPSLMGQRVKVGQAAKAAVFWGGLGAFLFIGYAFRDEASILWGRLIGELLPHSAQQNGDQLEIRKGRDGHFSVEALVDGVAVRFLIDTGASDVVLSPRDAKQLGFDVDRLNYSKTYRTANGTVKGAPVVLERLTIGAFSVGKVRASVNGASMGRSLLGMSYLSRLSTFEIRGNSLILRP